MKNQPEQEPSKGLGSDPEIEERVRQMLDPSLGEPKKAAFEVIKDEEPGTAPEVDQSLKEPLKIELQDEEPPDEPKPARKNEPATDDIDKAVEDIQAHESDELLKKEDEAIAKAFEDKKPGLGQRVKNFFSELWQNKKKRRLVIIFLLVIVASVMAVPQSRYFMLNNVGVRSAASVRIIDDSTKQPLRNVSVSLRGVNAKTDENGEARFEHLKLGSSELAIERRAFAPLTVEITLGWGSNPLGEYGLQPTGAQYAFVLSDYLSGKPLEKAEAISGEFSAFSDENGKILLTVDDIEGETLEVIIKKEDYRDENLSVPADTKDEQKLSMAAARPHVFVSKRSGKYDVYRIDADGKNEKVLLKGTGSERDDLVLVQHPKEDIAALVSTRGNVRNSDGFLLSTLTLIDLSDDETEDITQSERVQIVDWSGDRLVYVKITSGASAVKPDRHKLISYDFKTGETTEIAQSNYFNDVMMVDDEIYYAPSSAYQDKPVSLIRVKADGSGSATVINEETWNLFRTSYDKLVASVGQKWYEYDLKKGGYAELEGEPANLASRLYRASPDGENSLWVDRRDGKGVLLVYDIKNETEKVLHAQSGLRTPVSWLSSNTVVFRVQTDSETADYAVSLDGGEPQKIRDVTATSGIDRWYYY